jgi:hypothetical protein
VLVAVVVVAVVAAVPDDEDEDENDDDEDEEEEEEEDTAVLVTARGVCEAFPATMSWCSRSSRVMHRSRTAAPSI